MSFNVVLMTGSVNTLLVITYLIVFFNMGLGLYESTFLALLITSISNILSRFNLPVGSLRLLNELRKASVIKLHNDFLVQSLRFRAVRDITVEFNLGGALIPLTISTLLLTHIAVSYGMTSLMTALMLTALSTLIVNRISIVIRGLGLAVPVLMASLLISVLCLAVNTVAGGFKSLSIHYSYLVAYVSILLGVDLMNLSKITFYAARKLIIGGLKVYDALSLMPATSTIITYTIVTLPYII
ncbi:MAG: DUF1614 domain-containing protein [Sulfolobales archaeon]